MKDQYLFSCLIEELAYLVDNGAFIPKKIIDNILHEGYSVTEFIEFKLPYKMYFTFLNKDNQDPFWETMILFHEFYGHKFKIENNGLMYLISLCTRIISTSYFDDVDENKLAGEFWGCPSETQMYALKNGEQIINHKKYPNKK